MLIGFITQATQAIQATPAPKDAVTLIVQIGSIVTAASGVLVLIITRFYPWLRAKRDSRSLQKVLGPKFPKYQIENAISYYITPSCQSIDPAGGEEPLLVFAAKQNLFSALDDALNHPTEYHYTILLADSGMGKTAAIINYCARHLRRWGKKFEIAIVPLGIPDADTRIVAVEAKEKTVLFLDALDEDTLANVDYRERLRHLLKLTADFYRIVLTCRTQFFSTDDEIPKRTGIMKVGARAAGEAAEYSFNKIYLSPFSSKEIKKYLKRRYAPWRWTERVRAREIANKILELSARPMLLAHIDDIMQSNKHIGFSFELYEIMVDAWLEREEGFIPDKVALRDFSERLAVDLYLNRERRGGERASRGEVQALALEWDIELDGWYLTSRSLLNRDGEGNYKFAHRSIMEFLISKMIMEEMLASGGTNNLLLDSEWTDQINIFVAQLLRRRFIDEAEIILLNLIVHPTRRRGFEALICYAPELLSSYILARLATTTFPLADSISGTLPDSNVEYLITEEGIIKKGLGSALSRAVSPNEIRVDARFSPADIFIGSRLEYSQEDVARFHSIVVLYASTRKF